MATVKSRIESAQKEHDEFVNQKHQERDAEIQVLHAKCENEKNAFADSLVDRILSGQPS